MTDERVERSMEDRLEEARRLAERGRAEELSGNLETALSIHEEALALLDGLEEQGASPLKVDVLRWMGTVVRELGETPRAEALYRRSLELAEELAYPGGQAHALNWLAIVAQRRGEMDKAAGLYRRSARLAHDAGDHRLAGMVEQNRGVLANIRGDLDGAFVLYRAALEDFERAGDQEGMSWVLNNIGMLRTDTGRFEEARESLRAGLAIAQDRNDTQMECLFHLNLAESYIAEGRWDEAEEPCEKALAIAEGRGDPLRRAEALKFRAVLQRERQDSRTSGQTLGEALELAREGEDTLLVAEVLRELGETSWHLGARQEALDHWSESERLFRSIDAVLDAQAVQDRLAVLDARAEAQ